MAIVKLISDFDGVWTKQEVEAEYVWNYIVKKLSELTGDDDAAISGILAECKKEMDRTPWDYGWFSSPGQIACYYQEDPFGDNNAIFDYIERAATTSTASNFKLMLHKVKESLRSKLKMTPGEFSNDSFMKATTQFKLEGKLKPVDTAGEIVKKLNDMGVEIVVVSNSKTEKIEHLFRKAGHAMTTEKMMKRGRLHARGDAKKFMIDSSYNTLPESLSISGRFSVKLRRDNYHKILTEEKPDYVIGDVFSLDLALPLYLRLNDKSFGNLKIIQRVHPHTPQWVKDYLAKDELKGIAFMVDSIDELPELLK